MSADDYHKRKLGNRVLQPETQMMGYGYDPKLSEGSLKPPIFLTSTFVFRNAQDGKDFFDYTSGRRQPPPGLIHHSDRGVQPGFKGSSQRLPASIVAPRQRLRRAFSSQGSFAVWH